jgi:membrane protease YdiL (CAAX protease family)
MLPRKSLSLESVMGLILGLVVSYSGAMIIMGLLASRLEKLSSSAEAVVGVIVGSVAFHGAILLGTAVVLRAERLRWAEVFGFQATSVSRAVGAGLGVGAVATVGAIAFQRLIISVMEAFKHVPQVQTVVKTVESANGLGQKVCFGVVMILAAPLAEEIFFRGILYPGIRNSIPWLGRLLTELYVVPRAAGWRARRLAAWLYWASHGQRGRANAAKISATFVSLTFAASHGNLLALAPLFLLALVLTGLYERTGNLLAPITAHSFFNAANFAFILFGSDG